MPFKRAGWLQQDRDSPMGCRHEGFQCPLSGLVGCNWYFGFAAALTFQCPLSGLVGCNRHRFAALEPECFNAL